MSSGWSRLVLGDRVDGLRELFEGVALFRATRSDLMGPTVAVIHAEGLRAAGRPDEALVMLRAAAQTAREGHVGVLLPDVYRLIGELHFEAGELAEAEGALAQALEIARAQNALSLELRAALAMYPLLAQTGRHEEGIERVRSRYERFEDSFDQPDLVRARTLLEESAQYS
jgi:tetratricopeptide (TPR) repeat protein